MAHLPALRLASYEAELTGHEHANIASAPWSNDTYEFLQDLSSLLQRED